MKIRQLLASTDLHAFRDIRIESTKDAPESFRATEEEMRAKPIETFRSQLTPCAGGPVFIGAFEGDILVGVAALFFEESSKLSHKATIGAVFVTPRYRQKGIGRGLVSELLRIAREDKKLKQLNLAVSTTNKSAVKLYEDLGFSVFGTEPNAAFVNGKGYDEHHMRCVL